MKDPYLLFFLRPIKFQKNNETNRRTNKFKDYKVNDKSKLL